MIFVIVGKGLQDPGVRSKKEACVPVKQCLLDRTQQTGEQIMDGNYALSIYSVCLLESSM